MAKGDVQVQDVSLFFIESIASLGGGATFTGPWRDCTFYNWVGALGLSDVTGTLYVDEADAASPTNTNMVQKQAAAATDANAPSPPAAGFQARVAPTKTIMQFVRSRYINGGGAQARFFLYTTLSPLN